MISNCSHKKAINQMIEDAEQVLMIADFSHLGADFYRCIFESTVIFSQVVFINKNSEIAGLRADM